MGSTWLVLEKWKTQSLELPVHFGAAVFVKLKVWEILKQICAMSQPCAVETRGSPDLVGPSDPMM
jgi:hypothetical protein